MQKEREFMQPITGLRLRTLRDAVKNYQSTAWLAADWLDARDRGRDTTMIAYTNAEVDALNTAGRRLLDERGVLVHDERLGRLARLRCGRLAQ